MFKIALIFLIITLIIGLLSATSRTKGYSRSSQKHEDEPKGSRHVSKATGEYVEFEDIGKKENQ